MGAPVLQFVDRVGTGSVLRLNMNDGKNLRLLLGPDFSGPNFSPPTLKRAIVSTLLSEGAQIPASAYDNRLIVLPLRVTACDEAEMASILQSLHRELDRPKNILKWHPTYNFAPVYFRTYRSPDYVLDQTYEGKADLRITLKLMAEPFALGDRVDLANVTVNNDPAAVSNPMYVDISDVLGDVATPLFLKTISSTPTNDLRNVTSCIAVRRHGIPGGVYYREAEDRDNTGPDTTQVVDAGASGGQKMRTTFATDITLTGRLEFSSWPVSPAANSEEFRGTYRMFAVVKKSVNSDDIKIQLAWSGLNIVLSGDPQQFEGDIVTLPTDGLSTFWFLQDLGLFSMPAGPDPVADGYSGIELAVRTLELHVRAGRTSGTGNLEIDFIIAVPADEELTLIKWSGAGPGHPFVVDGPLDTVYGLQAVGSGIISAATGIGAFDRAGSIPLLAPNQTNRLVFLQTVGTYVTMFYDVTGTTVLAISYWPRYLYIR